MPIIAFLIFIFGLMIGSFLNVVVLRLEKGEGFVKGRSYCPHCKHQLAWYDLVPVVSFLMLLGRCRYCKKNISFQYPLVELATAIVFLLISTLSLSAFNLMALCCVGALLIIIFVYDLRNYLIPDVVLIPAIIIALPFYFSVNHILAAVAASVFFLLIFLISRGAWMGFGDVKLVVLLGLLLGFPNILAGLFLAFAGGAIIGVISMMFAKKGLKSELPFAPFLISGSFVAFFWGPQIISWYTHFLLF